MSGWMSYIWANQGNVAVNKTNKNTRAVAETILTWCDTNTVKGPTSAKKPIYPARLVCTHSTATLAIYTHLGNVVHDTVYDLPLERLEHDRAVAGYELRLPTARKHHSLANVQDGDDGNDITKFSRAGALNVRVELGLEEVQHSRTEVGRVEENCVRELLLRAVRRIIYTLHQCVFLQ